MKKRFIASLLLSLILLLCLGGSALASGADTGYVADAAGLLSDSQIQALESEAAAVSEKYGCGIYIVTVPDYSEYGYSVDIAAENIYTGMSFGLGAEKNGTMLLLSMEDRDYYHLSYGSVAHTAFTDYGIEQLAQSFLDDFRNDDWYGGFEDFIRECGLYLDYASQGTPVDVYQEPYVPPTPGEKLIIAAPIGCIAALIVCLIFRGQMKTAKKQTQARNYIEKNGVDMRVVQDHFTHRTQTVTVIRTDSGGSRGGGGTSINSRGFSGGGGKF